MSAEHQQPRSPEKSHENQSELNELAAERLNQLEKEKDSADKSAEKDPAKRAEAAREVINKDEVPVEVPAVESAQPSFTHRITHAVNFEHTMTSLQNRLSPASKNFSKAIHSPAVEKTSEALEKTVMRPSVLNGALWTAVVVQGFLYVTARYYGFTLSGSEIIISLLAGGLLGIVLEGIWRSLKRK